MELAAIHDLLNAISGCTFASIDSECEVTKGIRCITIGTSVMLFSMKEGSGYENMVKRRLEQAGKDPKNFVLGDLPWGERIPNSPLIYHKGKHYLQTILLYGGAETFYIGRHQVDPSDLDLRKIRTNQGLPVGREVHVRTYALDSISKIMLLGEEVGETPEIPVLEQIPLPRRLGTLGLSFNNDNHK